MADRIRLALLALALAPFAASAAGLGRLALYSMVGEPLNAEIEIVSLQSTEAASLAASVAPTDVYRQAQIAPLPSPEAVRVGIERRPDGRQFVKVSSTAPVDQPLVNLLVELSWAGGGIVRQYSFLLDSVDRRPTMAAAPAAAPTPPPAPPALEPVSASAPEPMIAARDARDPVPARPAPVALATSPARAAAAPAAPAPELIAARDARDAPPARPAPVALTTAPSDYTVQPGDTLRKIAQETLHQGVTVSQMGVAIFRANEDAFLGGNVNRLKAGRTLKIPNREAAAAVTPEEARQLITAQRTPADDASARPVAPAPTRAAGPSGDDVAALDRAIAESRDRAGELERTVAGLKQLIEGQDRQIEDLQRQLGKPPAKSAAPARKNP